MNSLTVLVSNRRLKLKKIFALRLYDPFMKIHTYLSWVSNMAKWTYFYLLSTGINLFFIVIHRKKVDWIDRIFISVIAIFLRMKKIALILSLTSSRGICKVVSCLEQPICSLWRHVKNFQANLKRQRPCKAAEKFNMKMIVVLRGCFGRRVFALLFLKHSNSDEVICSITKPEMVIYKVFR